MQLSNLLKSKTVLYVVLFLAITNVVGYIYVQNFEAIVFFLAVAYLSTYFSKNMIVNLAVPMLATNIIFTRRGVHEGMSDKKTMEEGEEEEEGEEGKEGKEGKGEGKKEGAENMKKQKQKQKFSNRKLSPSPASESEEDAATGKRIDYSSTLEQAYDNLQDILGDGGMENLTSETRDLIKQQKSLMKTMQSMAPILKNANSVLSNVDMSQMSNAMGSISSLLGGFGGSKDDNK